MKELKEEEISKFIDKSFALIYLYTSKCPHCQNFSPIMELVSKMIPDVEIGKVNIFEAEDFVAKLNIAGIPYLAIFQKGQYVGGGSTDKGVAVLELARYLRDHS